MSTVTDKPIIEIINWSPFAVWNFKTSGTECHICKQHYEEPCLNCSSTHVNGELVCFVSRGKCGHCFHEHCIGKWLSSSTICPICSTPYSNDIKNLANNEEWKKIMKLNNTVKSQN